jgi:PmbA protein
MPPGRDAAGAETADGPELARAVVRLALAAGATAAEAVVRSGTEFAAAVRLGEVEKLEQASFRKLGLRVFDGGRAAAASTSDFTAATLASMVGETLAMARAGSVDPSAGLPDPGAYAVPARRLELAFPVALEPEARIDLARRAEAAALAEDPRVANSEGAGSSDSWTEIAYASSLGVSGAYAKSVASLHAAPLAVQGAEKQRDYWLSTALDRARLETPEAVGREAARRVLRRLGARKAATGEVPVVFDPLSAARLLRHVADAASGTALVRKASFLLDRLGTRVAAPGVHIVDDALLASGLGSRPFDAEGVPSRALPIVDDGILAGYLLDAYTARKLGMASTASSAREVSGPPKAGPSNFYLRPGSATPEAIVASVRSGLYVTELIGFGVNVVSGDFSQGAAGIWIDGGALAYPVEEITVAGNLKEMLLSIEAVGNDPVMHGETFAPTVKIGKMMVSGN